MVFVSIQFTFWDGLMPGAQIYDAYCVNDVNSQNYGVCYVMAGKARFVQTDTSTYPVGSLPCEESGTCIRYTNTVWGRPIYNPLFDYGSKQAILTRFTFRSHTSLAGVVGGVAYIAGGYMPSLGYDFAYSFLFPSVEYDQLQFPIYSPVVNFKVYRNPYAITSGNVVVVSWSGTLLTNRIFIGVYEDNRNNIWYMASGLIVWSYESSPLAVIPLDYDRDYLPYQEIRNIFGFSYNGVDQPGWNAGDIMSVLRDLFPDRAWAVFDDRTYTLYLYNLTLDYVPDWLIERLNPIAVKVLMPPSDSSVAKAWLNELNRRNAYNAPPPEVV